MLGLSPGELALVCFVTGCVVTAYGLGRRHGVQAALEIHRLAQRVRGPHHEHPPQSLHPGQRFRMEAAEAGRRDAQGIWHTTGHPSQWRG